jgi:glucosyl-3-phosphoglycerate synthase
VRLSTAAVIPARDEAETLAKTLEALQSIPSLSRIFVVDDGSRDATAEIARTLGAEVLPASPPGKNRGKGHALRAGLALVRELSPDAFLLADADLGPSAGRLSHLIDALDEDHPAVVAAFPPSATRGGFGLVKSLSRRAILRRTGYAPSEPLSGQRALLPSALAAMRRGIAPGFGAEVGMTLDLLSAGIKPLEVPLPLTHRPTGRNLSGFTHRARQGLDVARALRGARIPW